MRSCLICGSETRPIKVEREVNLGRTEINMIRCVFTLREMKKIVEYRELLRWEPVSCSHLYFSPIPITFFRFGFIFQLHLFCYFHCNPVHLL